LECVGGLGRNIKRPWQTVLKLISDQHCLCCRWLRPYSCILVCNSKCVNVLEETQVTSHNFIRIWTPLRAALSSHVFVPANVKRSVWRYFAPPCNAPQI